MFQRLDRVAGRVHRIVQRMLRRAELAWHGRRCNAYGFELELPAGTLSTEAAHRLLGGGIDGEDQRPPCGLRSPWRLRAQSCAGCGMSAMGALRQVGPSGKVVAVEADPDIHALARRNFARNHMEAIISHNAAAVVDRHPGPVTFYKKQNYYGSNLLNNFGEGRAITVPGIYPPDLIDHGYQRKVLLADIEGYETSLLSEPAIIEPFDLILVELHFGIYPKERVSPLVPMFDALAKAGFRIIDVDDEGFVFGGRVCAAACSQPPIDNNAARNRH